MCGQTIIISCNRKKEKKGVDGKSERGSKKRKDRVIKMKGEVRAGHERRKKTWEGKSK